MQRIKNFKLTTKMMLAFGVVLALMLVQGIAAFVAAELVVCIAGELVVAEDHLAIEIHLGALELGNAGGVAHQHARVPGQSRGAGVCQPVAFLASLIDQQVGGASIDACQGKGRKREGCREGAIA